MNTNIKLYLGDCKIVLKQISNSSIDFLATDPPYGYGFMGKDWDTFKKKKATKSQTISWMNPGMKKDTEGMVEFFIPIWKECLRVLKPGAFAFVMCAPRQDVLTKQIIALQEAGFRTDFTSIYWTYASGFPKASNIGKKVDKRLGKKRKIIGKRKGTYADIRRDKETGIADLHGGQAIDKPRIESFITIPTSPQAKQLDGSYGGFQPKPAVEIIIVAMKPLSEKTYVDQALKNKKGVTWLDDCRIPHNEKQKETHRKPREAQVFTGKNCGFKSENLTSASANPKGRFPANLIVSDDVLNDGKITKGQQGATTGKEPSNYKPNNTHGDYRGQRKETQPRNDSGSYSRYFSLDKWWEERIKQLPPEVQKVFPYLICPKASKSEKNKGLKDLFILKKDTPEEIIKEVERHFKNEK